MMPKPKFYRSVWKSDFEGGWRWRVGLLYGKATSADRLVEYAGTAGTKRDADRFAKAMTAHLQAAYDVMAETIGEGE
jgi:hypothetical protein